jgi:hypothetical protein
MCNESRPIARQLEAVASEVDGCAGLLCRSSIKGGSDSDSGQLRTALSAEAEHAVLVACCAVAWVSYALDCLQDCVCGVNGQIVRVMPESICPAVQ